MIKVVPATMSAVPVLKRLPWIPPPATTVPPTKGKKEKQAWYANRSEETREAANCMRIYSALFNAARENQTESVVIANAYVTEDNRDLQIPMLMAVIVVAGMYRRIPELVIPARTAYSRLLLLNVKIYEYIKQTVFAEMDQWLGLTTPPQ